MTAPETSWSPNWVGTAQIRPYYLVGPDRFLFRGTFVENGKDGTKNTVNWTINYPADVLKALPDPSAGSQLYRLTVVFMYGDQSWDIAGFVELGTYLIN